MELVALKFIADLRVGRNDECSLRQGETITAISPFQSDLVLATNYGRVLLLQVKANGR